MAELETVLAEIALIERKLNSGVSEIAEGDRRVRRDLKVLRDRLTALENRRDALVAGSKPMIRSVRTTSVRGY